MKLLSVQHHTALDDDEATAHFARLDQELELYRSGQLPEPAWKTRSVARAAAARLSFEHRRTARDGFVYCETHISMLDDPNPPERRQQ